MNRTKLARCVNSGIFCAGILAIFGIVGSIEQGAALSRAFIALPIFAGLAILAHLEQR